MTKKLQELKNIYNGAMRITEKKERSSKELEAALHSFKLPKGISYEEVRNAKP